MHKDNLHLPRPYQSSQALSHELFRNNENSMLHTSYRDELAILSCVRDGDTDRLTETYERLPKTVYGRMSADDDRQMLYASIANTTLVTRYAIEGGVDEEEAFSLSDIYIRRMEKLTSRELEEANIQMVLDFTQRVHLAKQEQHHYRPETEAAIAYVSSHCNEQITTAQLADAAGLSQSYFCTLFHRETGMSPAAYIRRKRIEKAENLLQYSDYDYSEIAEYLCFSSQSHFTQVFHEITGMTPQKYRKTAMQK